MTGWAELELLRTDPAMWAASSGSDRADQGAPAKGRYTMAVLLGVLTLPGSKAGNGGTDTTCHA
jgi:hypothetical protein